MRKRTLYFQTWSHDKHTTAPTTPDNFMYINVEHAIRHYVWKINDHAASNITAQLIGLDPFQHFLANAAVATDEANNTTYLDMSMNRAIDTNPLTSNSALKGPDAAK